MARKGTGNQDLQMMYPAIGTLTKRDRAPAAKQEKRYRSLSIFQVRL